MFVRSTDGEEKPHTYCSASQEKPACCWHYVARLLALATVLEGDVALSTLEQTVLCAGFTGQCKLSSRAQLANARLPYKRLVLQVICGEFLSRHVPVHDVTAAYKL